MLRETSVVSLFILLAGIALTSAAAVFAADGAHGLKATFYVAPDGSDAWSGTLAAANAEKTDGPFATLEKAQDALRPIARKGQKTPLVVLVRGGKYFLERTFTLGPKDAGTRQAPVVFAAYPGEKPVVSGGRRVVGWQPYKDRIFVCDLPGSKGGKWKFRRLFADGQPCVRARWPKIDPNDHFNSGWAQDRGPGRARQPHGLPLRTRRAAAPLGETDGSRGERLFRHQ